MKAHEAEILFEDFSGKESTEDIEIELSAMDNLTMLGRINAIEYVACKHSDRKEHIYRLFF